MAGRTVGKLHGGGEGRPQRAQLEAAAREAGGGLTRGRTACDGFGGTFLTFSGWAQSRNQGSCQLFKNKQYNSLKAKISYPIMQDTFSPFEKSYSVK